MAYKTRTPIVAPAVATERLRTVLTLASQANITTQNLRAPRKNTTGYQ